MELGTKRGSRGRWRRKSRMGFLSMGFRHGFDRLLLFGRSVVEMSLLAVNAPGDSPIGMCPPITTFRHIHCRLLLFIWMRAGGALDLKLTDFANYSWNFYYFFKKNSERHENALPSGSKTHREKRECLPSGPHRHRERRESGLPKCQVGLRCIERSEVRTATR